MSTRQQKKYGISVDKYDTKCLTLQGQEYWPDDEFASPAKSMAEIIINAANYASSPSLDGRPPLVPNGEHFSFFDRPLYCEPVCPNPYDEKQRPL